MILGTVKGSVWATKKDEKLNGHKLMIIKTENDTIIASDFIGAGIGDNVIVSFGSSARELSKSPIDAVIVGIVDSLDV